MLSIITPVLNGGKFIRKNIESIKSLSIPFEHIIVDGGSTDDTLQIVNEYPHLKLIRQTEKKGMYQAIDMGFRLAQGEYITWVNCDEYIKTKAYENLYNYAKNHKKINFATSDGIINDVNTNKQIVVRSTRCLRYFLTKGFFAFLQPSAIYTKSAYYTVGGLRYDKFKIVGDLDLFIRMARDKRINFGYLPIKTTVFLKYGQSLLDQNLETANVETKQIKDSVKIPFLLRILLKLLRLIRI